MYFKRIPWLLRKLLPSNLEWNINTRDKVIYLTFDDGPIPEVTPWVIQQLEAFNAKATFFCVGDNVSKHPGIYQELIQRGHSTGNHSFNHLKAWETPFEEYLSNVSQCQSLVNSKLFRPPHGQINAKLARSLGREYRLIMWTVLTRDFDKNLSGSRCLETAVRYAKPGSILVFHDSIKAWERLEYALPRFLEHFSNQGYTFAAL